ncbi:MAG: hypothetical protein J6T42_00790, partial [Clostridia bacterium]|nr:hypothetical protein [Clostridia bacterium]
MKRITKAFILFILCFTLSFGIISCNKTDNTDISDNSVIESNFESLSENDSSSGQSGDSSSGQSGDSSSDQSGDSSSDQSGDSSSDQSGDSSSDQSGGSSSSDPVSKKQLTVLFQGDSITDNGRDRNNLDDLGGGYAAMVADALNSTYGDKIDFTF